MRPAHAKVNIKTLSRAGFGPKEKTKFRPEPNLARSKIQNFGLTNFFSVFGPDHVRPEFIQNYIRSKYKHSKSITKGISKSELWIEQTGWRLESAFNNNNNKKSTDFYLSCNENWKTHVISKFTFIVH